MILLEIQILFVFLNCNADPDRMTNEDIEQAKKEIGTTTSLWFYTKDINNTYKELQEKGVNITEPKKQDWGGIMSQIKD